MHTALLSGMSNSELTRRSRDSSGVGRKLLQTENTKLRKEHVKYVQDNVLAMAVVIILYMDNYVELRMSTNPARDRDTVGPGLMYIAQVIIHPHSVD